MQKKDRNLSLSRWPEVDFRLETRDVHVTCCFSFPQRKCAIPGAQRFIDQKNRSKATAERMNFFWNRMEKRLKGTYLSTFGIESLGFLRHVSMVAGCRLLDVLNDTVLALVKFLIEPCEISLRDLCLKLRDENFSVDFEEFLIFYYVTLGLPRVCYPHSEAVEAGGALRQVPRGVPLPGAREGGGGGDCERAEPGAESAHVFRMSSAVIRHPR